MKNCLNMLNKSQSPRGSLQKIHPAIDITFLLLLVDTGPLKWATNTNPPLVWFDVHCETYPTKIEERIHSYKLALKNDKDWSEGSE